MITVGGGFGAALELWDLGVCLMWFWEFRSLDFGWL